MSPLPVNEVGALDTATPDTAPGITALDMIATGAAPGLDARTKPAN